MAEIMTVLVLNHSQLLELGHTHQQPLPRLLATLAAVLISQSSPGQRSPRLHCLLGCGDKGAGLIDTRLPMSRAMRTTLRAHQ